MPRTYRNMRARVDAALQEIPHLSRDSRERAADIFMERKFAAAVRRKRDPHPRTFDLKTKFVALFEAFKKDGVTMQDVLDLYQAAPSLLGYNPITDHAEELVSLLCRGYLLPPRESQPKTRREAFRMIKQHSVLKTLLTRSRQTIHEVALAHEFDPKRSPGPYATILNECRTAIIEEKLRALPPRRRPRLAREASLFPQKPPGRKIPRKRAGCHPR